MKYDFAVSWRAVHAHSVNGLSSFAIIAVSIVIFIRYRDPKIVIPIIVTSITEALLVLGIAGMIQWTIDLPAIAGLIASIGTGVNDQIIITDEIDKKREKEQLNMKRKIKNAFFIVFSAAATIVAAMIPLLTVGAGGVMGFAFTTIVGVFVGILITRPAYAKFLSTCIPANNSIQSTGELMIHFVTGGAGFIGSNLCDRNA